MTEAVRIDKWLWAARFFKTRGLAQQAIDNGRVLLAGARVKPAHPLRGGEVLAVVHGDARREVVVLGLSQQRGPAPVAQQLYEETAESVRARTLRAEQRRFVHEPADAIRGGRPTKRDRRELGRFGGGWAGGPEASDAPGEPYGLQSTGGIHGARDLDGADDGDDQDAAPGARPFR